MPESQGLMFRWTEHELKILHELYPQEKWTIGRIMFKLPGRSRDSITCKANELGIQKPEERRAKFLKK